jgi:phospholipid/cholesterol/gamma-HCH transport system ATP-binding protein
MEPIISVRNLVNEFGRQRVHDRLCLDVQQGEILGIVGGSGSGKSVLLRSMLGLHRFQSGEIRVLGQDVRAHRGELARCWGVLFQNSALLSGLTVRQNVEFPIALHSRMDPSLRCSLAELKIAMAGLPVAAGEKYPSQLSGGMRKRASLARALALDPKVLFLDEPTAGLDPIGATEFDELIAYLQRNLDLTVVIITHDVDSMFAICNRVAVLVDKRMVIGKPEEMAASEHPWIHRYFNDPRARRAGATGQTDVSAH